MPSKPIIITDIDGCLTDYPQVFVDWVNQLGDIYFDNLEEIKRTYTQRSYETIKSIYRHCGVKQILPLNPGASQAILNMQKYGYRIWIITSRPKIEPVISDTHKWLKINHINADELIFVNNKAKYLNQIQETIAGVIDDNSHTLKSITLSPPTKLLLYRNQVNILDCWPGISVKSWREIPNLLCP